MQMILTKITQREEKPSYFQLDKCKHGSNSLVHPTIVLTYIPNS